MAQRKSSTTRRDFIVKSSAVIAAGSSVTAPSILIGNGVSPNDKLNIAFVGIGGRGGANLGGLSGGNNVVALCDVDERRAGGNFNKYPDAKKFKDHRVMLDSMDKSIDVVSVSTPDHTHAAACMGALKRKKHVYCEKPLAHSVHEGRALAKAAKEAGVVTQLGNQGHSFGSIRDCVEWIRDGAIGKVHTIHAACSAVHTRVGQLKHRKDKHDIPKGLDWDLWLGPQEMRPYNPMYLPSQWRAWRPYGNGTIGDWVCHVVDPSFWALELGSPTSVETLEFMEGFDHVNHTDTFARGDRLRFEFPATDKRGPITMYWYSGDLRIPRPDGSDRDAPKTGAVIIGDKGIIQHGSHGGGGVRLVPESKNKDYKRPARTIPRVRNHHVDFLDAIRNDRKAGSDFHDYGAPLTELAMIGIISMNFPKQKLEWDGKAGKFTNNKKANEYLNPPARKGWEI